LNRAERSWQRRFIFAVSRGLLVFSVLLLSRDHRYEGPDRSAKADAVAVVEYRDLAIGRRPLAPGVTLTGAWEIRSDESRLHGLSALAIQEDGRLLAASDSGVWVNLPRPGEGRLARFRDFAIGPGSPIFKKNRDAEALLVEGDQRLVAFEWRHSLWAYPPDGPATFRRLVSSALRRNSGIEAMVRDPAGRLLLIPERGDRLLRVGDDALTPLPLQGRTGGVADATRLADGRMLVAIREVAWLGLRNRLAWLRREERGYRLVPFSTLPVGPFDNVEGLAAEALPGGGSRVWAVTDDDSWRRVLLLRIDFAPPNAGR
jgi:hypothetical protein